MIAITDKVMLAGIGRGREGRDRQRTATERSARTPTSRPRSPRSTATTLLLSITRTRAYADGDASSSSAGSASRGVLDNDPDRRDAARRWSRPGRPRPPASRTTPSSRRRRARPGRSATTRRNRASDVLGHVPAKTILYPDTPRCRAGPDRAPRQVPGAARDQDASPSSTRRSPRSAASTPSSAGGATPAFVVSPARRRHDRRRPGHPAARRGRGGPAVHDACTGSSPLAGASAGIATRTRTTTGRRSRSSTSARCPG